MPFLQQKVPRDSRAQVSYTELNPRRPAPVLD
jgi:hypothetical protein